MSLNAREVAEILKALEASSFDSLDLEIGGVKLSLRRSGAAGARAMNSPVQQDAAPARAVAVERAVPSAAIQAEAVQVAGGSAAIAPVQPPPGALIVPAPLLGVFYRAPKPGEPPFVEVGGRVEEDTIIGIIEVMKLMNTVRAGLRGQIVAIPARNGELVEFGEALLFVRPD